MAIQTGYKRHYMTIDGYPLLYMAIYSKKSQHAYINTYVYFTITVEILERSLANFYGQYADRHINFKFVRRVSKREQSIQPFVIEKKNYRYRKNKLMPVFSESALLLTMNFVKTLSK